MAVQAERDVRVCAGGGCDAGLGAGDSCRTGPRWRVRLCHRPQQPGIWPVEIDRPETIEETGDLIRAAGGEGSGLVVDHEDTAMVAALLATIEGEHGRLDLLVNDIFGGDRYAEWDKPLWEHDWTGGLRMLQMGVHTHLITCEAAIPLMLRTATARAIAGRLGGLAGRFD